MSKNQYRALCAKWQQKPSKELFASIVRAASAIALTTTDLAVLFEVSEGIIDIWSTGKADPSLRVQNEVVAKLTELAFAAV
jgi:predicted transcriptional regulator